MNNQPRKHQFSLGAAILLTTAAAAFLALLKSKIFFWRNAMVCAACVPIVLGLCQQAWAIRQALRQAPSLQAGAALSWQIAARWRFGVAAALVISWVAAGLVASSKFFVIHGFGYQFQDWSFALRLLLIILGLAGTFAGVSPPASTSPLGKIFTIAVSVAGLLLAAFVLCMSSMIDGLIHMAIHGLVNAQPYRSAGIIIENVDIQRYERICGYFRGASLVSVFLTLLAIWFLLLLFRKTNSQKPAMWLGWCAAALPVAGYGIWMHAVGLAKISPFLAESPPEHPWLVATCTALVGGLFCAAMVWSMYSRHGASSGDAVLHWHGERRLGIHESRIAGCFIVLMLIIWLLPVESLNWKSLSQLRPWEIFFLENNSTLLGLAAIWLGSRVVILSPTAARISAMERLPITSLRQLLFLFAAAVVTLFAAVETVKWSTFMLWIS